VADLPLISLLVPAYREETVLGDTLTHLAAEIDYPAKEIVVGVDGVEDRTREIAEAFAATHADTRVHVAAQRQGVMATMRTLIGMARGEILIKHDADRRFGNPSSCLHRIADRFRDPRVGGLFFTGERDFRGSIFAHTDPGWRDRILAERHRSLTTRGEAFASILVDTVRVGLFPLQGYPPCPVAIHCFHRRALPDVAAIPTDLIHDDVWFFYRVIDAGLRVDFAPDVVHWTSGGLPPSPAALFRQKVKGFVGWQDSGRRHGFSFRRYLGAIVAAFLRHGWRAGPVDLAAFAGWSTTVAAAAVWARVRRRRGPTDVWVRFDRPLAPR